MKRYLTIAIVIVISLSLAACVSQEEYDLVLVENEKLLTQMDELNQKMDSLVTESANLEKRVEDTEREKKNLEDQIALLESNNELLNEKVNSLHADLESANGKIEEYEKQEAERIEKEKAEQKKKEEKAKVTVDYLNETDFEAALNSGADLTGKVVTFGVDKIAPNSAFGYNLQTGAHLNFCSPTNPNVSVGDKVTVKVTSVVSVLGSWVVYYSMV